MQVLLIFMVLVKSTEPVYGPSNMGGNLLGNGLVSSSPTSFVRYFQNNGNLLHKRLHHNGLLGLNQFGILGNVAGLHPGLVQTGLGRAVSPLLANNLRLKTAIASRLVNPVAANAVAQVAARNVAVAKVSAAANNAARINAGLALSNRFINPTVSLGNPLLNQGILRPDIWQLGIPQLGLNHHRLLQSHPHAHSGLLYPSVLHSGFLGPGYGFPFGGGVPHFDDGHHHDSHSDEHYHISHNNDHVHNDHGHNDHGHNDHGHNDHGHNDHGHNDHGHNHHNNHDEYNNDYPHDHPLHLPVHPEDLDFIEMNEDAPFQAPSCSRDKTDLKWCLEDKRYPRKQIEHAGHIHAEGLMDLYADISDLDTELSVKGKQFLNDETYLCSSETSYIRPLRAINTQGKWRVIVNNVKVHYQKLSQSVRIEECLTNGEPCPLIPHCYSTKCLQKFNYHRFLVFDPYDHNFPFAIETFRLPSSCSCKMHKYILDIHYK